MWKAVFLAVPLAGCVITDERPAVVVDTYYTKSDVDAIIDETNCRKLARTLVQIEQCGPVKR
jgi:hypothetical protein